MATAVANEFDPAVGEIGITLSEDRQWVPTPHLGGGEVKVLGFDEPNRRVSFLYRFEPNAVLPRHSHQCTAQALTLEGEWEYGEGKLPVGAFAYEPVGTDHTPQCENGALVFITLFSDCDQFLTYHMADGSDVPIDISVFRALDQASRGLA